MLKLKPVAVLDASLLARKGTARPATNVAAMRPFRAASVGAARVAAGFGGGRHKTVATTVRLSPEVYLRLKLFATLSGRTRQDILQSAVEGYLAECAEGLGSNCACLRDN